MIGKILLGMTLTTAVVMKDGMIEVNVQEKRADGSHVHLYVPATVATWGVHLAPQERLREHLRHSREHLALARVALRELEKVPDAILVEVESPREHVRVQIRHGSFFVDVDDEGETVHVAVPISAARKVIEDLEADAPAS
ncbi:MAG TPA: hypothetical protein VJW51_12935 [Candidatus Acidoferrales bacterium]|nr:hypothetical protein [Candidatus Acidoferrales bacterium]